MEGNVEENKDETTYYSGNVQWIENVERRRDKTRQNKNKELKIGGKDG